MIELFLALIICSGHTKSSRVLA